MKTISFEQIDEFHGLDAGTSKNCFNIIQSQLIEGVDYLKEETVQITLTGYVFIQTMFVGDYNDAKRKTIHYLAAVEDDRSPFDIIREQLDALEEESKISNDLVMNDVNTGKHRRYTVKKPKDREEENTVTIPSKDVEEKKTGLYRSYKYKQVEKEIREQISDPEADEWIRVQNNRIRNIVVNENLASFVALLRKIYWKMNLKYGFVIDQIRKEVMDEYELTDKPSVLRCIAQQEVWKTIFENMVTSIECNGYRQTMEN